MTRGQRKRGTVYVEPSLLAGDVGALAQEAQAVEAAGADGIHIDLMDGHFVPQLSFGCQVVEVVRKATALFIDVHLMTYQPFKYVEELSRYGADAITFHIEATEDLSETVEAIRCGGLDVGLAFSPGTPVELAIPYLALCDRLLVMTVEPGLGGQKFIRPMADKLAAAREMVKQSVQHGGKPVLIQVDGGVDLETGALCVEMGADELVSGSFLFREGGMQGKIAALKALNVERPS